MIAALLMVLTSLLSCSIAAEAHQIDLTNARIVVGPDRTVGVEIAMNWRALRVSADRVAKPAAHTRAESRGSRPSNTDAAERLTLCWREVDSNPRSPEGVSCSWMTGSSC